MPRVFLIHGWDGNPQNHWFPWFSLELKARGWEVNAPHLPHTDAPKVGEWLTFLKEYAGQPNTETYFVGHSIGCQAILRYLESLPEKAKIGGAILVAGWLSLDNLDTPEEKEIAKPWIETPIDFAKAKIHCQRFVMIFSDNDPYVPMEHSLQFSKQLGAKTILERGKKHFSDGMTALPSALSALLKADCRRTRFSRYLPSPKSGKKSSPRL